MIARLSKYWYRSSDSVEDILLASYLTGPGAIGNFLTPMLRDLPWGIRSGAWDCLGRGYCFRKEDGPPGSDWDRTPGFTKNEASLAAGFIIRLF